MTKVAAALVRALMIGLLLVPVAAVAGEQTYPSRPIRMIIPYPPGGGSDVLARIIADKLAEGLGQPVIVDNRGGGNTIIGTEAVVKSPPDGYTLLQQALPHVITPLVLHTPYDVLKDFTPVATLIKSEWVLVVNPSLPVSNLQELIALAKAKPGELNYASAGTGSVGHLALELLGMMTGAKMQHIPYKGTGPAVSAVLGGQVQVLLATPISALPHIKAGKLKALAYSDETRWSALPDVPTFAEAGLPGFRTTNWYGILAPAGTPRPIVDKLSAEIARILALPDVKEKLALQGMEPYVSTPEQFAAMIQADSARLGNVVRTANIKLD